MINSRSKLIFILLPGIKEYLKQHAKNDSSCELIQRALKVLHYYYLVFMLVFRISYSYYIELCNVNVGNGETRHRKAYSVTIL